MRVAVIATSGNRVVVPLLLVEGEFADDDGWVAAGDTEGVPTAAGEA